LHQEGESTNQDSVAGGKSDGDGVKAPTKASDEEGEDSGQPKAEGSEKFTNNPKVDADASSEAETKEAGIKGNCSKCGKPNFLCKGKCSGSDSDNSDDSEKKDDSDEKKDEKDCTAAAKCDKCECDPCTCKEAKTDEDDKEEKEAKATVGFKKIANLTSAEKTRLGKYWKNIYPDAFVEAMLADK